MRPDEVVIKVKRVGRVAQPFVPEKLLDHGQLIPMVRTM